MYIKSTTNSAGAVYYHLVESYWENGKSRQRTLLSLGKASENKLDELAHAISKHKDFLSIIDLAKTISIEDTYILGPLLVLQRLFETSGINSALKKIANQHPKLAFDFHQLVFTMVASRFLKPGSKLKIYEHWQNKLYPEMVRQNISLHQLYRCLDLLAQHKNEIETGLYWHGRDLLSMQTDVVLYDLTTLRFESTRTDMGKLRQFGYSKEMRSDCTQVVLGLLVTPEGIPVGFEVYPGNTFEGKTIESIIEKLRTKYHIRRFIFVGDRGLFSKKNLDALRSKSRLGEFIVGMKLGLFKKRHQEFYDTQRFDWINKDLAVYETTHEGDRCIVTWSRARAERDRKAREDILNKLVRKLAKKNITAKEFVTNKTYQRYVLGLDDNQPLRLNEKAIAEDAARDGFFGVVTNVNTMSAKDIIQNYKTLWIIEDAFGEIKGNLKARPVFHWKDERIIGHLTMCYLAYYCEAIMTKALREKNIMLNSPAIKEGVIEPRVLTVVESIRELQEVRAIPVKVKKSTMWVRTDIRDNAQKLFAAIGLKIPPKLLKYQPNKNPAGTNGMDTCNSLL